MSLLKGLLSKNTTQNNKKITKFSAKDILFKMFLLVYLKINHW